MFKHIILWKLHEHAEGASKKENALKAKQMFESLNGKIPGLIHLEVGIDEVELENSADIVLYCEFESLTDLENYQNHPEHIKLKPFILSIRSERRVIDYSI